MRKTLLLAALLGSSLLAAPASATGADSFDLSGFAALGRLGSAGNATATSSFGGQAEAFANGSAGLTFSRCGLCNAGSFTGYQTNEAGALTTGGNTFANGFSTGFVNGDVGGGFVSGNFTRRFGGISY